MRNQSGVSLQISLQSTGDRLINLDRKFSVSNCTSYPHLSGFNNISFQQLLVCKQDAVVWAFRIVVSMDIAKEQRGCFNQSGSDVLIGTQICKYAYSMYMINIWSYSVRLIHRQELKQVALRTRLMKE